MGDGFVSMVSLLHPYFSWRISLFMVATDRFFVHAEKDKSIAERKEEFATRLGKDLTHWGF